MRRAGGFTLLEQVIAGSLLSLVLGMAWAVMQPCLVDWKIVQDRSEMQRGAHLVVDRVSRELLSSTRNSVTIISDPPAMAWLCASDATHDAYDPLAGTPLWNDLVVYFLDTSTHILYRKTWPAPSSDAPIPVLRYNLPTTAAFALSAAELRQLCATSNGTERPVCTCVDSFDLKLDSQAAVLKLQLSWPTRRGVERLTRQTAVHMRIE